MLYKYVHITEPTNIVFVVQKWKNFHHSKISNSTGQKLSFYR